MTPLHPEHAEAWREEVISLLHSEVMVLPGGKFPAHADAQVTSQGMLGGISGITVGLPGDLILE